MNLSPIWTNNQMYEVDVSNYTDCLIISDLLREEERNIHADALVSCMNISDSGSNHLFLGDNDSAVFLSIHVAERPVAGLSRKGIALYHFDTNWHFLMSTNLYALPVYDGYSARPKEVAYYKWWQDLTQSLALDFEEYTSNSFVPDCLLAGKEEEEWPLLREELIQRALHHRHRLVPVVARAVETVRKQSLKYCTYCIKRAKEE